MNTLHGQIMLLALCCFGYMCCSPLIGKNVPNQATDDSDSDHNLFINGAADMVDNDSDINKRVERYAFGLGRRAYMYTNGGVGMKRLPVYNFGLGKRSRPYSFGLGKRSDYDYEQENEVNYRPMPDTLVSAAGRESRQSKRTTRPQPFNFGLGKR
ncbi:Ast [Drosophila busckii]|uniref:Ast n=1 Tax=Drosophila busckii TaxID=30019 RepID=A0A0M4EPY2_DROBS|nr:allatostatin-A [Drosophila busckii]ALC47915.1 Ast [Drosophila busckii]